MDNTNYRYTPKEDERLRDLWNEGVPSEEIARRMRRSKASLNQRIITLRRRGMYFMPFDQRFAATASYRKRAEHEAGIKALEDSLAPEPAVQLTVEQTRPPEPEDSGQPVPLPSGWRIKTTLTQNDTEVASWEAPLTEVVDYGCRLVKWIKIITEDPTTPTKEEYARH